MKDEEQASTTEQKFPHAKIETVTENLENQSLKTDQITAYCKKLFHFKTIRVMRFKWVFLLF